MRLENVICLLMLWSCSQIWQWKLSDSDENHSQENRKDQMFPLSHVLWNAARSGGVSNIPKCWGAKRLTGKRNETKLRESTEQTCQTGGEAEPGGSMKHQMFWSSLRSSFLDVQPLDVRKSAAWMCWRREKKNNRTLEMFLQTYRH